MTDTPTNRLPTLRKTALFTELSEQELNYIAERAVVRHFEAGQLVFSEGEACPGLWIVETGKVRIYKSSPSGREQVLAIEGPGSSVAELPVFDGGKYPASAASVSEAKLLFISKEDFQSLCLKHPEVALKVLRIVGRRLRGLVGIIEELSFTTVRHRLISLLVRMAKEGHRTNEGVEIIAEGTRLFALAGRPTKAQFIKVYGANGPRMTWAERAAAGVDAKHFQAALAAKS